MNRHTSANRVPRARPRQKPDSRRGAALMIAIIVLTALMLLAIPFAAFMRRQHAAGTQALHAARAETGEAGGLSHALGALWQGLPNVEEDRLMQGIAAGNSNLLFPYNDPNVDTLWEFRVTLRTVTTAAVATGAVSIPIQDALGLPNDGNDQTVDGYVRVDNEWMAYDNVTWAVPPVSTSATLDVIAAHRGLFGTVAAPHVAGSIVSFFPSAELWNLDVEDPQSKININTAPYRVIRNLLGYLRIGGNSPEDAATGDPDVDFPSTDQMAIAKAIVEYRVKHLQWLDIADGTDNTPDYQNAYTPFQNIEMLKSISLAQDETTGAFVFDATNLPLSADEFDLLRPHITVNSGYAGGGGAWLPVGALESDMIAGAADPSGNQTELNVANLSDASRFGVGSTVWFQWTNSVVPPFDFRSEFRTVLAKNGCGRPLELVQDCAAADTSIVLRWAPGFVGASVNTPCYIKIDDEWIMYTGVAVDNDTTPTTLTLNGCVRGQFRPVAVGDPHLRGLAYVDGDVVCWQNTLVAADDPPPLIGALSADCLVADAPVIQVQNRHGVNVNTCTDPVVLQSIFYDVDQYDVPCDTAVAAQVTTSVLSYTSGGDGDFFTGGNEDWFDGLDGPNPLTPNPLTGTWNGNPERELHDFFLNLPAPLSPAQAGMLAHNANALTVPIQFNSGALLGLGALAVADDRAGTPVAQAPSEAQVARLYDVVSPLRESMWQWRSQKEFYEHILANSAGKNVLTMPLNEGLLPPDPTAYPSDYDTYAYVGPDTGTVTAALDELRPTVFTTLLEGLHGWRPDFTLDYSAAGDLYVSADTPGFDNTTAQGMKDVHLQYNTNYAAIAGERHVEADSFLGTIQPFALELWVRPPTSDAPNGEILDGDPAQLLVDIGAGSDAETAQNQARLYFDWDETNLNRRLRLVLRLDDQVGAGCVKAWSSNHFDFEPGVWHHVAVAAVGTFRHEIAMFIDGIYDRDMDWHYYYQDALGGVHDEDESSVNEAYFWPVAMNVPVKKYMVAAGPDSGGWDPLNAEIGLTDISDLPPVGWVAIGNTIQLYEYNGFGSFGGNPTLLLLNPLTARHDAGELVTCMIPVVRPATHRAADDPESVPVAGDPVGFWACTDLGNGAFQADPAALASSAPVAAVMPNPPGGPPATNFPAYYDWLVFDPDPTVTTNPVIPGVPGDVLNVQQSRWKAFRYDSFVGSPAAVLAGLLPSGAGATMHVGADANGTGTSVFEGEIDELRITALPSTMLQRTLAGDWPSGSPSLPLLGWQYLIDPVRGFSAEEEIPPSPFLVKADTPVSDSGGFFVVCDSPLTTATPLAYSYQWYGAASLNTIEQRNEDLTPAGPSGTAQPHRELRPVMPLNFITSTSLAAAFAPADGDILVLDARQFPPQGYVRIGAEIIGYSGKGTGVLRRPGRMVGPEYCSAYPRGAYGTTEAGHLAGAVVRHLPVRHPDRYREEDPASPGSWTQHVNYTEAQLDGQMCMVSFPIDRAGKLKKVSWQFKHALEDGQKVAVLVRIDDPVNVGWNADPYDDDPEDLLVFGSQNDSTSKDLLWGTISADPDPDGELTLYKWIDPAAGTYGYPTATSKVEVRFYFDLSGTDPYRYVYTGGVPTANGWQNMIEIDKVQIEMAAESGSY